MNGQGVMAANVVTEFCKSEAGDYGHFQDFQITEVDEHGPGCYGVEVEFPGAERIVNFRVSNLEGKDDIEDIDINIEVCMYEDVYEEVRTYDWHVKYFWIALLWK